jgi:multidrug efflux pump subunit AcrA (membrane-fusion protein)
MDLTCWPLNSDSRRASRIFDVARLRRPAARLGVALIALPLVACQVAVGASEPPQPQLAIDSSAGAASGGQSTRGSSNLTYTVRRGTIRDTLNVPGRVVPALSAQVVIQSPGSVAAIDVHAGQAVKKGDPLVEVAVDQSVLDAARTRATLADLEYDSQQAKVDAMQRGLAPNELAAARANLARAQAELRKAQIQRDAVATPDPEKAVAAAAAKDNVDKEVALAEFAVQTAKDELGDQQTELQRVQSLIQQAQSDARATAQADAETANVRLQTATATARVAAATTRTAQRKIDEATARLDEAQGSPNATRVEQDIAAQNNQIALVQEALHDAQAAADGLDGSKDPTGVIAANATTAVRNAGRELGHEIDHLQLVQATLDAAKQADARAVRLAQLDIEQGKDDLAQSQAAEQQANQDLQRVKDGAAPPPRVTTAEVQLDLPAAEARVRAAQRKILEENLHLEQARTTAQAVPDTSAQDAFKKQAAEADIQAAQAGVDEAQARLAALQQGTAADDLAREQRRATVLQDAAAAAHQAVEPTFVAVAPFDGTVSNVGVGLGQLVEARTIAAQVAGVGSLSVKASATESDVTGLSLNQKVSIALPSLGDNVTAEGTVVEISGTPASTANSAVDAKVTYPVTVELGTVPPALKLGMSATLNVDLRTAEDVLYVPSDAIRTVGDQTLATTVNPSGQVVDTPVRIGALFGSNVEVLDGLQEGDVVTVFSPTVTAPVIAATARR